ncbi:hypothetical protein LXL04_040237 [Taraxacum kok-saghyz]
MDRLNTKSFLDRTYPTYDTLKLHQQYLFMSTQLNAEQKKVFDQIHLSATSGIQSLIFVYGYGGTGKTFLWSTILAYLRSRGLIVLAVAASGIASLLLPAGRTAHSRLKIPLDLSDSSTCHIKKKTHLGQLLQETFAIVWDEATMNERKCFECVDRSLKDILDKPNLPFGGMTMLVGGDFRQTLPVKPKLKPAEVVGCTLPNSPLWRYFTVYPLLYNMRLSCSNDNGSVFAAKQAFASWLIDIGNGIVGIPSLEDPENISDVDIPNHLLISTTTNHLKSLIDFVYTPDVLLNPTPANLSNRAIVCPKNVTADIINSMVMAATSRPDRVYLSEDSISATTQRISDVDLLYPPEYLNTLPIPGLPLHNLTLTINCPVLLMRNLDQGLGLCNGTRLFILMSRIADLTDSCVGSKLNVRILRRWAPRFRPNQMWFLAVDQFSDAIQILSIDDGGGFGNSKFQLRGYRVRGLSPSPSPMLSKQPLNRCYTLDAYICIEADKYQRVEKLKDLLDFTCGNQCILFSTQRFIKNNIYITVGRASNICQVPDCDALPTFWFSFASIAYLESLMDSDADCPDVIGYFNGCEKLSTKNNDAFVKLDLIHESGRSLPVTLWKECVSIPEKFDPVLTTSVSLNTVIAITNIKPEKYSRSLSLSSTSATHVIIHPPSPSAALLESRARSGDFPDPLAHMTVITIENLKLMDYNTFFGKTILVRAQIVSYDTTASWYSTFCCKCKKLVRRRGNEWFCVTDGVQTDVNYSFYIQATIEDETKSIPILLVDDVVKKLCGCTCGELISRIGNDDRKNIPDIFQKNVDCFYTFHVQLGRQSTLSKLFYTAISVTIPEAGISTSSSPPSPASTIMSQTPVTIVESEATPFPTFPSPISIPISEPYASSSPIATESKVITQSEKQDTRTSVTKPEPGILTSSLPPSPTSTTMSQTPVTIVQSESSPFRASSSLISTPVSETSGSSFPMATKSKIIAKSEKEDTTRSEKAIFSSAVSTPVSEPSDSSSPIPTGSKVITENTTKSDKATFSSAISTPVSEPSDSSSPMATASKVITESEKKRTTRSGKARRVLFVDADPGKSTTRYQPTIHERYED